MVIRATPTAARVSGTTRGLPPGRDYDHFCDAIADVYIGVRPERLPGRAFAADFEVYDLGPFALGRLATPAASAHRDRRSIARLADDAVFVNVGRTSWGLGQHGRTWAVEAGTAMVLDNDRPFTVLADPRHRLELVTLRIPRERVGVRTRARLAGVDDRLAGSPLGLQIGAQVALLVSAARAGMAGAATAMADAVVEMLDTAAAAEPQEATRLDALQRIALQSIGDPAFGVGELARAARCSVRTAQAAFASEGTSFSAWLRAERLDQAREALHAPSAADRSIAAIARAHGFADPGTFHRAYRARFGRTPGADR